MLIREVLGPITDYKWVSAAVRSSPTKCHFHDFLVNCCRVRTYLITNGFADSATPTQYANVTRLSPAFRVRVWLRETTYMDLSFG